MKKITNNGAKCLICPSGLSYFPGTRERKCLKIIGKQHAQETQAPTVMELTKSCSATSCKIMPIWVKYQVLCETCTGTATMLLILGRWVPMIFWLFLNTCCKAFLSCAVMNHPGPNINSNHCSKSC